METLLLIKPNATKKNKIGEILAQVEDEDFTIKRLKTFIMNDDLANEFYAVHKGKHFFPELVKFMKSGLIVGVVLEREDAVKKLRKIIGATNYKEAKAGTIRAKFADGFTENAVHGSDSEENAQKEIKIIFN